MDAELLVLVRWDRDGTENVVALKDLVCGSHMPQKGSRVLMPWGRERWHGTVISLQEDDFTSDSEDDNVPLLHLKVKGKSKVHIHFDQIN